MDKPKKKKVYKTRPCQKCGQKKKRRGDLCSRCYGRLNYIKSADRVKEVRKYITPDFIEAKIPLLAARAALELDLFDKDGNIPEC